MKCGQKTCDAPATAKVYWPGREPLPMCSRCTVRAQSVADAMGFYLVVEDLIEEQP